uniref:Uncharacterized protein n=1 Tax=Anopheles culicifacies TaxID=139723 RepID=A0A182MSW0_9DIPT
MEQVQGQQNPTADPINSITPIPRSLPVQTVVHLRDLVDDRKPPSTQQLTPIRNKTSTGNSPQRPADSPCSVTGNDKYESSRFCAMIVSPAYGGTARMGFEPWSCPFEDRRLGLLGHRTAPNVSTNNLN